MRVKMERCPGCGAKPFVVDLEELVEADGFMDCECGNQVLSQNRDFSDAIFQSILERSANPALEEERQERLMSELFEMPGG